MTLQHIHIAKMSLQCCEVIFSARVLQRWGSNDTCWCIRWFCIGRRVLMSTELLSVFLYVDKHTGRSGYSSPDQRRCYHQRNQWAGNIRNWSQIQGKFLWHAHLRTRWFVITRPPVFNGITSSIFDSYTQKFLGHSER